VTDVAEAQRIDTELAAQWHVIEKAQQRLEWAQSTLLNRYADVHNIRAEYKGKRRYIPVKLTVAMDWMQNLAETDPEGYQVKWGYYNTYAKIWAELAERRADLDAEWVKERELQRQYTGWSRFFVVTSSTGHIHSSMACHTCKITTTYGWMPDLSGLTEVDAVAKCGPALCSVCFPSAPLDALGKLSAAQARKLSA
jgi:hypothetical protein